MPAPQNIHLDPGLTNFATRYSNSQFIADSVCPEMPVSYISASFKTGRRVDNSEAQDSDYVGNGGAVNEIDNLFASDTYRLDSRALMQWVGEEEMATNSPLSPEENAVANVMQRIKMNHEKRVADVLMTTTSFLAANRVTVSNAWTNKTSGTPVDDIINGLALMPGNGDDTKVVAACSDVVFNALRTHPQILALKGTTTGLASIDELKQYLGLDDIFVSKVSYNTANKGQTASYSRVWSSTKFGLYTVPRTLTSTNASLFACSFRRGSFDVMKWFDPSRGSYGMTGVKVAHMTHAAKVLQNDMGVLLSSVA